jgi:hypothetical protein
MTGMTKYRNRPPAPFRFTRIVERENVRMRQLCGEPDLPQEALAA